MVFCIGYLTDPHIPFHSPRALNCALNCLADSNLGGLYLGGDIFDMYWAHDHGPKDPRIYSTLEHEAQEVNKFLDLIDMTWPTQKKVFIEGNHETRYERYVIKNAPSLFGMTSLPQVMNMHQRVNWNYVPFGNHQLKQVAGTDLYTKHAPRGSSGAAIMNANACNLLFGHIHRIIYETKTTGDGRILRVMSPGWLGNGEERAFSYVPGHQNWQNGFARIWVDLQTKDWRVEIIEIRNGVCYANGRKYVG